MNDTVVILDNVRSAHNVGSIFRTADGAGVHKLYLAGVTPSPVDRFGRVREQIAKTSLGASETVAWERVGSGEDRATAELIALVGQLKANGYQVVAVEQAAESVPLKDFSPVQKVAYIFGAEVEGVQPDVLAAAAQVIEIPMQGQKESLNVSVVAGIVLLGGCR